MKIGKRTRMRIRARIRTENREIKKYTREIKNKEATRE